MICPVKNCHLTRIVALVLAAGFAATAQNSAKDTGITREQAEAILNELRQIRQLLEKQAHPAAPAPPVKSKLKIDGGYSLGAKDAALTMVEFTDYQCPFCRQFQVTTFGEIRKKYIDTGKLRFVSRNMPLDFHANAMRAAEAALCAGDQGQFWQMRDVLFSNPGKLAQEDLVGYAQNLHLNMPAFRSCLENGKHKSEIMKDLKDASALQITGTPSFLIGKTTPDGVDGHILMGAQPLTAFEAKLKESETEQ